MDYDDAYANGKYIPGSENLAADLEAANKAFFSKCEARVELGIPYGGREREAYDLFQPRGEPLGTLIFIHGGYWRILHRSFFSSYAAGALARGWAVAMPSYDLCPNVRISDITRQIAGAVKTIAAATTGPISIAGHSAGGHLTARMLDPALIPGEVAQRFHRVVPISPLSDLRPLMFTEMNDDLRMDAADARAESPLFMADRHPADVTVWVGSAERPVFLDQARWLSEAWDCGLMIWPHHHHFDVIGPLREAGSHLTGLLTGPA